MEAKKLEPFPPNENPFHYDLYNMGIPIGKNVMIMYSQHEINKYIIVINMITGERMQITL